MADNNFLNFATLDYRLNGLSANGVVSAIRNFMENELEEKIEHCPKSIFNKIIQVFKLKKSFFLLLKNMILVKKNYTFLL